MSAHAELCPVCGGSGKYTEVVLNSDTTAQPQPKTCHGCFGLGWVVVNDETITVTFSATPLPAAVKDELKS